MTTGSWLVGDTANLPSTRFRAKKYWSGDDGKYEGSYLSRKPKWNNYSMAHLHFESESSDLGLTLISNGADNTRDNSVMSGADNYVTSAVFPSALFDSYWDSRKESDLLAKLLNKVKGHSLNIGVALAEVDKMAGTMASTIKNLAFGVVDLSKLRFAAFARRFGTSPPSAKKVRRLQALDISGRFLEMRYAWQPAIEDAYQVAQAFEGISNGPRQQTFKKGGFINTEGDFTPGNYRKSVSSVLCRRIYTFQMYEELSVLRQVGLANPASILWERLPWSFVLDWFLPVGNYLELIGQIPYLHGKWLRTDSVRLTGELSELNDGTAAFNRIKPPIPRVRISAFYMRRSVLLSPPPVPSPQLKVAGAVQGKRLQNALALAHQIFFDAGRDSIVDYHY